MAKQYKIKRYNSGYRSRRNRLSKLSAGLLWILGIAALIALGFYGYQSVMDYIENSASAQPDSSSSSIAAPVSSVSSSSAPAEKEEPKYNGITKAALLPQEMYGEDALQAFLENASESGINTIVVTYKDEEGIVYHDTAVEMARKGKAVPEDAADLSAVAKQIREAGMFPAALIYGFEDHTVSYELRDVAGHYKDEDYLWYDDAPEKGGKAWLNPYDEEAQNYLIELAAEAAELGFEEIIMDGVHFPKGYQLDAINFGETGDVSKSEVLRGFADSLSEILDGMDARLSMVVLASDITSPNGFTYGSDSALELFDCKIYLDLTEEEEPAAAVAEILTDKTGDFGVMLFDSGDTAEQLETMKDLGAKSWFIRSWAEEYPLA